MGECSWVGSVAVHVLLYYLQGQLYISADTAWRHALVMASVTCNI